MTLGRPQVWDREKIKSDMLYWAELPDSLNINAFCYSFEPKIPPSQLCRMVSSDEDLCQVYEIVKAYLAVRREEANSEKLLSDKCHAISITVYDYFVKEDKMNMLRFEKELNTQDNTPVFDKSLEGLFANLPMMKDVAILKEQVEKLKAENDELKRQADSKRDGSQQEIQHLGGSCSLRQDLLKHIEIY